MALLALFQAWSWNVLIPASRPVRFVADYSYSLYLIHFSLLVWCAAQFPTFTGWAFITTMWLVCNVAAVIAWWLFERHFGTVRRWMDRLPFLGSSARASTPRPVRS